MSKQVVRLFLSIHILLKVGINNSGYAASDIRMFNDWCILQDVEGSGLSYFKIMHQHSPERSG